MINANSTVPNKNSTNWRLIGHNILNNTQTNLNRLKLAKRRKETFPIFKKQMSGGSYLTTQRTIF
jgi:hypothetical protein